MPRRGQWLDTAHAYRKVIAAPHDGVAVCDLGDVPGRYAVSIHHDVNENGHMNFRLGVLPMERWGVSRDAPVWVQRPRFCRWRGGRGRAHGRAPRRLLLGCVPRRRRGGRFPLRLIPNACISAFTAWVNTTDTSPGTSTWALAQGEILGVGCSAAPVAVGWLALAPLHAGLRRGSRS